MHNTCQYFPIFYGFGLVWHGFCIHHYEQTKRFFIMGLTLQDLIDYAIEHEFEPSQMAIKIEDIDTCQLHSANMDYDEIFEPMIVLY